MTHCFFLNTYTYTLTTYIYKEQYLNIIEYLNLNMHICFPPKVEITNSWMEITAIFFYPLPTDQSRSCDWSSVWSMAKSWWAVSIKDFFPEGPNDQTGGFWKIYCYFVFFAGGVGCRYVYYLDSIFLPNIILFCTWISRRVVFLKDQWHSKTGTNKKTMGILPKLWSQGHPTNLKPHSKAAEPERLNQWLPWDFRPKVGCQVEGTRKYKVLLVKVYFAHVSLLQVDDSKCIAQCVKSCQTSLLLTRFDLRNLSTPLYLVAP